jgi:hypothetical protein
MVGGQRLPRILVRMLDEKEFLYPYWLRALSKAYLAEPFTVSLNGGEFGAGHEPRESMTEVFGGNWRSTGRPQAQLTDQGADQIRAGATPSPTATGLLWAPFNLRRTARAARAREPQAPRSHDLASLDAHSSTRCDAWKETGMQNWIAGAMTVLGTLLVLSGAGIIILRAWPRGAASVEGADPLAADGSMASTADLAAGDPERGARALRRLGPPDRLIAWGILLLVLAALAAGAIGFELGANAPAK